MRSPLPYIGGKSKLAPKIISLIPPHKCYVEVFAGAGWVFFAKEPSRAEVINDLDGDLIAFYRVIQNHLEEFFRQYKYLLASREVFHDYKRQQEAGGLTDIQRAARYYYQQRLAFGGRVRGRTFGTDAGRPPRLNLLRMEEDLSEMHLRLIRVLIENLTWQDCIKRYDRPEMFFYLDPPYWQAPCYNHNFTKLEQFEELASTLAGIEGQFMLSINDHPDMRRVFGQFNSMPVQVKYSVAEKSSTVGKELLVANFPLKE